MSNVCGTGSGNFPQPGDPDLSNSLLSAVPAFGGIDVLWTYPLLNPEAVSHTLLYRSTNEDPATKVNYRTVTGDSLYDKSTTGASVTYYYWIQHISVNGTVGDVIGPAFAMARPTIEQVIQGLTGRIDESLLGQALGSQIGNIQVNQDNLVAETSSRIAANDDLLLAYSDLEINLANVDTLVRQEITQRTEADSTIVNQVNVLFAQMDDSNALILEEQTVRAAADEVLAQSVTTLESTLGGEIAQVETNAQTSIDTINGEVTNIGALYTTKVNVNGLIGGFGVYNDGSEVLAGFDVDTFFVGRTQANKVKPFIIKDGETFIDEAVIQSLTFNKLRADDGSLLFTDGKLTADYINVDGLNVASAAVFSGDVTSDDFVVDQSGWQILQNGVVEINNLKARGSIDGALINGSTIKGSVIQGTAFVALTEFGGNYAGFVSNQSWSASGETANEGWVYTPYINIFSANYSDTNEFRRYRRHAIDASVTVTGGAYNTRIIVYKGGTAVIDTGHRVGTGNWSGSYWSMSSSNEPYEYCGSNCGGNFCETRYSQGNFAFKLTNYPFSGDAQLRIRIYTRNPTNYSASSVAINDY